MRVLISIIAITIVIGSSVIAQVASDEEQIRMARARYNDAIADHNVPGIVSFHDDEYQVTTSLGQLEQGRDDTAAWEQLIASRANVLYVRTPEIIEVSKDYPLAAETGTWLGTWSAADGPVRTGGRYAAMWRKADGKWKVRSELFVALYCEGMQCP